MIDGSLIELICAIGVCLITVHIGWFASAFQIVFTSPVIKLLLLVVSILMAIHCNTIYVAYTYCEATIGSAILFASPIWSISVSYFTAAIDISPYSVTEIGIIGAITVVIVIVIILAKPSELFNIRNV